MAKPTDAELDKLKPHLFLFKDPNATLLPHVAHIADTDAWHAQVTARLKPIADDPWFKDMSFAVVLYPGTTEVKAFLHEPDENWDIGSGGKLSILAAAIVLRDEMRALQNAGLVNASNADDLFRYVWTRHDKPAIRALSLAGGYPQPRQILDFSKTPVDFAADPAGTDFGFLDALVPPRSKISPENLAAIDFRERLHLVMGISDNRAARGCQGQLGIAYINAVIHHLGLYSAVQEKGIRVTGPYSVKDTRLPEGWRQPVSIRRVNGRAAGRRVTSIPYAATARTLAMLMTSMVRNKFLPGSGGPDTMRDFLLHRLDFSLKSWALEGVKKARQELSLPVDPTKAFQKIGILWSDEEFLYAEYGSIRFGLIMLGLLPKRVGSIRFNKSQRAQFLAFKVYKAIHGLPW
jgi:hypothetical protein